MKDLMKSILLIVAIYSGVIASDSHGYISIIGALVCGIATSLFVSIKDDKKDKDQD